MTDHPQATVDETIMQRMREICAPLPDAVEGEVFGAPTFRIREKNFAMVRRPDHRTAVWCKAARGFQEAIIDRDPSRYFAPPYVGPKG